MMDPSRNHRVYRLSVGKLRPPMIPFMPLLMKGLLYPVQIIIKTKLASVSLCCKDITLNSFENGGRPPSRILKIEFLNTC